MKRKTFLRAVAPAALIAIFSFLICNSVSVARAYSINGTSSGNISTSTSGAPDFTELLSPIKNFLESAGSINGVPVVPKIGATPVMPPGPQSSLRGVFDSFDAWLYNVAGFHVEAFFVALLGIFSWVLGVAKEAVDWLRQAL